MTRSRLGRRQVFLGTWGIPHAETNDGNLQAYSFDPYANLTASQYHLVMGGQFGGRSWKSSNILN